MGQLMELLGKPENMIFIASEFIFIGLLALQLFGLAGDSDLDIGGDLDIDVDIDVDLDIDLDADLDVEGFEAAFNYPIMVMVTFFFGWFGMVGITGTSVLSSYAPALAPWKVALVSAAVSGIICYQLAAYSARGFAKVMPSIQNHGGPSKGLIGKRAKVLSATIECSAVGRVSTTDDYGHTYILSGKLLDGESDVSKGDVVEIVEFDLETQSCTCRNV